MENITNTPVTDTRWQLPLTAASIHACATFATAGALAPIAVGVAAAEQPVKRDRAVTGMGVRGIAAAPGTPAWSPPI